MKFDNLANNSGIGANSYKIEIGYNGPETPFAETIVQHTFIDGSTDLVNVGAREEKDSEIELILLEKTEFLTVESFFKTYMGTRIQITEEFSDEKIFMENFGTTGVPYFATIIEIGNYSEDDFSEKRMTFRLRIKLSEPVLASSDVFNPPNTGNLNVLIKINTIQAEVISPTIPPDLTIFSQGARWYDTTANQVKSFSGANIYLNPTIELNYTVFNSRGSLQGKAPNVGFFDTYIFTIGDKIEILSTGPDNLDFPSGVYEIANKEAGFGGDKIILVQMPYNRDVTGLFVAPPFNTILYTPPADNIEYNYINGVFYLASFFSMEASAFPSLALEENYVAGLINYKSIKLPGQSVDINKGPNIATLEGFRFSLRNNTRFWKTVTEAGIPLFGAEVTVSIYRNKDGVETLTKKLTGTNLTNSFSYTDYVFDVAPFLLNSSVKLPLTTISTEDERYKNIKDDAVGEPPYLTYGQFDIAALQNVSKQRVNVLAKKYYVPYNKNSFPDTSDESSRITGAINPLNGAIIYINRRTSQIAGQDVGFTFTDAQLADINGNGGFTINVILDTYPIDQDNVKLVRQVETLIADMLGDVYILTLTAPLPILPPASGNQMGTDYRINFLILNATYQYQFNEAPSGGFGTQVLNNYVPNNLRLLYLSENNKDLIDVPANEFLISQEKNSIKFNLIGVNDPSQAVNFIELRTPEGQTPLQLQKLEPMTLDTAPRPVLFTNGNGVAISPPLFSAPLFSFVQNSFQNCDYITPPFASTNTTARDPFAFAAYVPPAPSGNQAIVIGLLHNSKANANSLALKPKDGLLVQQWAYWPGSGYTLPNTRIIAFEFPVTHFANIDDNIPENTKVVLGINMVYEAQQEIRVRTRVVGGPAVTESNLRYDNEGVTLIMRVRMRDGTYRHNTDWVHTIEKTKMSSGVITPQYPLGKVMFNNIPNNDVEGGNNFAEGVTYPNVQWVYDVDNYFVNVSARNSIYAASPDRFGHGFQVVLQTEKRIDRLVYDRLSNTFSWDEGVVDLSIPANLNVKIRRKSIKFLDPPFKEVLVDVYIWNGTDLVTAPDEGSVPFFGTQVSGRDMFDLSQLFTTGPEWPDVSAIQFYFVNYDNESSYSQGDFNPSSFTNSITLQQELYTSVKVVNGPRLYQLTENFNVEDRPIFSAVEGKNLLTKLPNNIVQEAGFPTDPTAITCDIMNQMFAGKTNIDSIVALMDKSSRSNWKWRRQYIEQLDSEEVLKELMENLWAVIRFNEEDKFEFISLNALDHAITTPEQEFDDSSILVDSISNPKFRKTNEIFQRFELNYNFYPVSDFSESVPAYRNTNIMADIATSPASPDQKYTMRTSQRLYNTKNILSKNFKFHYDGSVLPMRDWIVDHYVYNAWEMKLSGSIDRILGPNALKIMSWVSVTTYFHTAQETVHGFITNIDIDVYSALCEFTIFIPRPLGYLGPLCDPFNDAFITGRNTPTFPQNDAGTTPRTTGSYLQKDAGTTPRSIEC